MESLVVCIFCAVSFAFGYLIGARHQYQEDMHEFLSCIEIKEEPVMVEPEPQTETDEVMNQLGAILDYQPKGRNRK